MPAEESIHLYHMGLDFLAKCSLQPREEIEYIRERLKVEAARSCEEDSLALRILANSLEPFLQD